MSVGKASDLVVKYKIKRAVDHYDLYVNRRKIMSLEEYNEIVSKTPPKTYDQVLIGEVLALLDSVGLGAPPPRPRFLSRKVYDDLKATFRRSRKAGEAKALALAKRFYLDDFNHFVQARAWIKIGSPPRILKLKMTKDRRGYCYSVRFSDGVDSITVEYHPLLHEYFAVFWFFKTQGFKQLISLLSNSWYPEFHSSIRGAKRETLLKALELALCHDTTLGAALFLTTGK